MVEVLDQIRAALAVGELIDHAIEAVENAENRLPLPARVLLPRQIGGFGLGQTHPAFVDQIGEVGRAFAQPGEALRFGVSLFLQSLRISVRFVERLRAGHDEVGDLGQPAQHRTRAAKRTPWKHHY